MAARTNRLAREKSPYLLQHAHNPVDWFPWGAEALERARREDKPVFLSIGYATCHWCHVMERESFEDAEVAKLLNHAFVNIKVDREERPDLDGVYMRACQALTGSGGWPLTIVMTPDGRPFYAATYIPKDNRFGRLGLVDLIPRIEEAWKTKRAELLQSADRLIEHLDQKAAPRGGAALGENSLHEAYRQLAGLFDEAHGGFGQAPKFPTPHQLSFLLRYWRRTGDEWALRMVESTLSHMRRGGIWDHVGGGFHRYSTDAEWKVPHFEKMLYDQAQLAIAYAEAFQATRNPEYAETAREILEYVRRELTSREGAFFSAEDADSEGVEGKYYFWTLDELADVLGTKEAEFVAQAFSATKSGNYFEEAHRTATGTNILHEHESALESARRAGLSLQDWTKRWADARERLLTARSRRPRPLLDDKILTDWNGLMISAFARATQALDEPAYAQTAMRASDFLLETIWAKPGRLLHRYRDGDAAIPAFLDDHAFLIGGLIDTYEATFETRYLEHAVRLAEIMVERFWDPENGGFFFTDKESKEPLIREKPSYDGAIPSGNSVAMHDLLRLARLTGRTDLEQKADALARRVAADVAQAPAGFTQLLCSLDFAVGPAHEVVLVGSADAPAMDALNRGIRRTFSPNKVVLRKTDGPAGDALARIAPFVKDLRAGPAGAAAYVCTNFRCDLPLTDPTKVEAALAARPGKRS